MEKFKKKGYFLGRKNIISTKVFVILKESLFIRLANLSKIQCKNLIAFKNLKHPYFTDQNFSRVVDNDTIYKIGRIICESFDKYMTIISAETMRKISSKWGLTFLHFKLHDWCAASLYFLLYDDVLPLIVRHHLTWFFSTKQVLFGSFEFLYSFNHF